MLLIMTGIIPTLNFEELNVHTHIKKFVWEE